MLLRTPGVKAEQGNATTPLVREDISCRTLALVPQMPHGLVTLPSVRRVEEVPSFVVDQRIEGNGVVFRAVEEITDHVRDPPELRFGVAKERDRIPAFRALIFRAVIVVPIFMIIPIFLRHSPLLRKFL